MKRLIWLPIAGFLLIAGAAVAAAAPTITAVSQSALSSLADSDVDDETDAADGFRHLRPGGGADLLDQVLADLVDAGTITQAQSDAITDALSAEIDARRAAAQQEMEQWQGFIEDGVITQEEVNQLPADSPFREVFNSIAEDGQINLDQLRELGPGFGHGRGHGFGPGWPMDEPPADSTND